MRLTEIDELANRRPATNGQTPDPRTGPTVTKATGSNEQRGRLRRLTQLVRQWHTIRNGPSQPNCQGWPISGSSAPPTFDMLDIVYDSPAALFGSPRHLAGPYTGRAISSARIYRKHEDRSD
jgi:hypothetical protein